MHLMIKTQAKKKVKECVVCCEPIMVRIYPDKSYRGWHYFGRIPLHTKKALLEALKAGYTESKIGNQTFQVMKEDPVHYKSIEYWECPKCYRRK